MWGGAGGGRGGLGGSRKRGERGTHQFLELGTDRLDPDPVALVIGVKKVGHDLPREIALGVQEPGAEIHEEDILAVSQGREEFVHLVNPFADGVLGRCSTGKDREQKDLGVRMLRPNGLHDLFDAGSNPFRLLVAVTTEIVGADHDHDDLRMDAVEFAVLQTPENLLGRLSGNAQIQRLPWREARIAVGSMSRPPVGDRVADQDEIEVPFPGLDFAQEIVVPAFLHRRHGTLRCAGSGGKRGLEGGAGDKNEQGQDGSTDGFE